MPKTKELDDSELNEVTGGVGSSYCQCDETDATLGGATGDTGGGGVEGTEPDPRDEINKRDDKKSALG